MIINLEQVRKTTGEGFRLFQGNHCIHMEGLSKTVENRVTIAGALVGIETGESYSYPDRTQKLLFELYPLCLSPCSLLKINCVASCGYDTKNYFELFLQRIR
jgi:hypothetical protein